MDTGDPLDGYKLLMVPVREIRALSRGVPQSAVVSGKFEVVADVPPGMTAKGVRGAVAAVTLGMATGGPSLAGDWTVNAETGRSNSSELFLKLCDEVARLIAQNGGRCLDERWISATAALIVAQLAHVHGLAPSLAEVLGDGR